MDLLIALCHQIWHYTILNVSGNEIRVSNVLLAILLSIIGFRYSKSVLLGIKQYLHNKLGHDKDTANALERVISYLIISIYIVSILEIANVPLSSFAFIGGALALGIGLGGQNLMSSFISSMIIMIERPIKIGDIVEIDGLIGTVTSIGARCVSLTSFSNVEILVPNNKVMQNVLVNWTFSDHIICNSAILSVLKSHVDKPSEIIDSLLQLLHNVPGVCTSPAPAVYLTSVSDLHYVYQVNFSCDLASVHAMEVIHSRVNVAVVDLLQNNDFNITYQKLASTTAEEDKKPYETQ